ncbi:MAG: phage virion morphogenesis protein [Methylococcaceae bacterium]|nr:phage virion morphogenesis protein [Methylococcaceae bacterium]
MITIQFDDRAVREALDQLRRSASDLRPAMVDIGSKLVSNIQQTIIRGQTPWGDAMAALKLRQGVPLNDTRQHIYNLCRSGVQMQP